MGESRIELLAWVNDLLQSSYTKVEQLGTGVAYCQIFDSIHGDVPLAKIRWDAKAEYEYVINFKVLQAAFNKHKIDKTVPVERLVKCKMQDNLEFLQWLKRYWDTYYPGGEYDALARRHGATANVVGGVGNTIGGGAARKVPSAASRKPMGTKSSVSKSSGPRVLGGVSGPSRSTGVSSAGSHSAIDDTVIQDLTGQVADLKLSVDGLEKERDFYFNKLRDIEILVQEALTAAEAEGRDDEVLKQIQAILYSTEEGFEVPEGEERFEEETY